MAELCIVCLGDLRTTLDDNDSSVPPPNIVDLGETKPRQAKTKQSEDSDADEIIAHLLPCGHNLHDQCLKPWVERANSCPTCRQNFNMVELRATLDGPAFSSYAVQDKQQQAELDPSLVIDDDLYEVDEPCLICHRIDDSQETMYCDGCDRACHVFCAGVDEPEVPEVWYCGDCLDALDNHNSVGRQRPVRRTGTRTQHPRARRTRRPNSEWARVWQTVWHRLNLDLDFPFEEETAGIPRTQAQRRELNAWQRRLQVANRQGGSNRFRDTAATLLERQNKPESQEELRAWNAFDKARELDEPQRPVNRRKRKSTTTSPASPRQADATEERKLKRPRTRRNLLPPDQQHQAESSNQAMQRNGEGPSFLTSLLQEVERQPAPSEATSPDAALTDGQLSPYISSPAASPLPSNHGTPRATSVTPPPQAFARPSSPTPLTSIVRPMTSPTAISFSPFSPAEASIAEARPRRPNGRQRTQQSSPTQGQSPQSPSRNLSYSTKAEIQRMVKNALGTRYRDREISKDQYTDINRDVSRMLYDQVGDAESLADQTEREKWQQLAVDEVQKAVDAIRAQE